MIAYLDTSAFVPLFVDEPTSQACAAFWNQADDVLSSRLTYVEAAAALAAAERSGRIDIRHARQTRRLLDDYWSEVRVIEVDAPLVVRGAELARRRGLRGYDAVHCASAEQIEESDLIAVSGDRQLLAAWAALGVMTYDPSAD